MVVGGTAEEGAWGTEPDPAVADASRPGRRRWSRPWRAPPSGPTRSASARPARRSAWRPSAGAGRRSCTTTATAAPASALVAVRRRGGGAGQRSLNTDTVVGAYNEHPAYASREQRVEPQPGPHGAVVERTWGTTSAATTRTRRWPGCGRSGCAAGATGRSPPHRPPPARPRQTLGATSPTCSCPRRTRRARPARERGPQRGRQAPHRDLEQRQVGPHHGERRPAGVDDGPHHRPPARVPRQLRTERAPPRPSAPAAGTAPRRDPVPVAVGPLPGHQPHLVVARRLGHRDVPATT